MKTKPRVNIKDYFVPTERQREALRYNGSGKMILYGGARGGGKAQPLDSLVSTPFGFKPMGEMKVGGQVNNPDGSVSTIIGVYPQGIQPVYKLTFDDGAVVEASDEHLWLVGITSKSSKRNGMSGRNYKIMTTKQMYKHIQNEKNKSTINNLAVPLTKPVRYTRPKKYELFDPYLLGLLIGDGCIRNNQVRFYTKDEELINAFINRSLYYDWVINVDKDRNDVSVLRFNNAERIKKLLTQCNIYNHLSYTKFIPEAYKHLPVDDRFELIRGLMDTDGYVDARGHLSYTTVSKQLAEDFQWIVRSLGAKATITSKQGGYTKNGERVETAIAYTVYFNSNDTSKFVNLTRKKQRCTNNINTLHRIIVSIEPIESKPCQCIKVDNPNGLYITNDFVVTHNTELLIFLALYTALKYPKIKVGIFRQQYRELEDEIIMRFLNKYPAEVFGYKYSVKNLMAKFENGAVIMFRAIETLKDISKIQGIEFQLMLIDEAPKYEKAVLDRMRGSLRNTHVKDYQATLYFAGNPGGLSDHYMKTRFVMPELEKWDANERLNAHKYVYIPSRVYDNPHIQQDYVENLMSYEPALRAAWLDGDWTVVEGQFFEQWSPEKHIVDSDWEVPDDWRRVGGLDFGMTKEHPTVFVVIAQDPTTYCLYIVCEYVNWGGDFTSYIVDIAELCEAYRVELVYADPAMWGDKRGVAGESSHTMFEAEGIPMEPANNSRVNGWRVVKRWMSYESMPDKEPLLKVKSVCGKTIETVTLLRYSERGATGEDCNTKGPDDAWDAIRYAIVRGFIYPFQEDIDARHLMENDKEKRLSEIRKKYETVFDDIGVVAYYG